MAWVSYARNWEEGRKFLLHHSTDSGPSNSSRESTGFKVHQMHQLNNVKQGLSIELRYIFLEIGEWPLAKWVLAGRRYPKIRNVSSCTVGREGGRAGRHNLDNTLL